MSDDTVDNIITANGIRIVDKSGRLRIYLGNFTDDGHPVIRMYDNDGLDRIVLSIDENGRTNIGILYPDGDTAVGFGCSDGSENASLGCSPCAGASIGIHTPDGEVAIHISGNDSGGAMFVFDTDANCTSIPPGKSLV